MNTPPILWSIAGTDSGGGAGLAADQRAADAFGVHCCTVVAGITAQSTTEVTHIEATPPAVLQAQLATLAADMPPRVIKTGLLGSADNVRVLARFVDQLREERPLALVVDPVLRASTGAALADAQLRAAYRDLLLPRATVITPNQAEALALLGEQAPQDIPAQARALRALGCGAVVITGGDAGATGPLGGLSLDWLDTPQATGWLSLPRERTPHNHGTGCTFASALASALALGWVVADAAVLAKMAATFALRHARAVGRGVGPVIARPGFANEPSLLPQLSLNEHAPDVWLTRVRGRAPGVYAIVDSAERVRACAEAGAGHHQQDQQAGLVAAGLRVQEVADLLRGAGAHQRLGRHQQRGARLPLRRWRELHLHEHAGHQPALGVGQGHALDYIQAMKEFCLFGF
mgnify:CR=1 FL=1